MPTVKPDTKTITGPVDPWDTSKETWQFVTIPDEDPLGKAFPNISLNKEVFVAGKTYQVPSVVASYVNDRIKTFNRSCVRLLQPNVDQRALDDQGKGSAVMSVLGNRAIPIDATQIHTV